MLDSPHPAGERPDADTHSSPVGTITASIDDLIVGRALKAPIYDPHGRLLLAAGAVITATFKKLLRARNIEHVQLHADDLREEPQAAPTPARPRISRSLTNEEQLTRDIDRIVDAGALKVVNVGPPVKDELAAHGCTPYDPIQRERLLRHCGLTSRLIEGMLQNCISGTLINGDDLNRVAASFLAELCTDVENVLTAAAEAHEDRALLEHSLQMSLLGMAMGIELGFDAEHVRVIGLCGLLHDWGLIRVPDQIRRAERQLAPAEIREWKRHPYYTLQLLDQFKAVSTTVRLVCFQVHEKPNGSGFPQGRGGSKIHQFAKVLHIADSYLTLTLPAPGRQAMTPYEAVAFLIRSSRQKAVDTASLRAFLQVMTLFPLGSCVQMRDGSVGRVLRRNGPHYTKPIVSLLRSADGEQLQPDSRIIDLAALNLDVVRAVPAPHFAVSASAESAERVT